MFTNKIIKLKKYIIYNTRVDALPSVVLSAIFTVMPIPAVIK